MDDLKVRAVRGGVAKFCGQVANFVIRLGYVAVMARILDPADFGLVAMVTAVTGIFELFTSAGLSSAAIQKSVVTDEQISTLFWINMLVGTILSLACLATAPVLVTLYHEPQLFWVTVAMAAGFLFNAAGVQHSALIQRELRHVAMTAIETLSNLASATIGIAMGIAGFGYWALVAAAVLGQPIMTASMWGITAWIPGMPRRNAEVRAMLRFGGATTLYGLVFYVTYNFDKFMLGRFWGAAALGVYGRAYQLINLPTFSVSSSVGWVAFSALSRLQDDPSRLRNYFLKGYTLVNSATVPITIFCALFADELVLVLLGPKWADGAVIIRLLTPAVLIFGITHPTVWLLHSIGLQERVLRISLVTACVVIPAYVIGLPYGPSGVAFALSAAMALALIPQIVWSLRNTVVSPSDLLTSIWRPFIASIVAAAVAFGAVSYFAQSQWPTLRLLVGGGVMASLYFWALLFILGQRTIYLDIVEALRNSRA
jgi:PST family polysaccharide transporter